MTSTFCEVILVFKDLKDVGEIYRFE